MPHRRARRWYADRACFSDWTKGCGWATLVAEWVRSLSEAGTADGITWLSLDEDDNDLARFLVYVVATLSRIEANIGKGVLNQLRASPPPAEEILTFLIKFQQSLLGRQG